MNGTVLRVCILALLCMAGLIAMLVTEAVLWDRAFLLLTALPLIVGGWSFSKARAARRDTAPTSVEGETE